MIDFKNLASKYQTPFYVYDFDDIKQRYNDLKDAFKARKSLVFYATKANSNLSLLKHLSSLGAGFDCVSANEIRRVLRAGAKKYKIIFSGVGKSDEEIEYAINKDILLINIESLAEYERVVSIAKKLNKTVRISVRVNPNIDAKTHPYISTGLNENKFGVDVEKAKLIYIKAKNNKLIEPVGIHFHIGSQLTDIEPIKESAKIVADIVRELEVLDIDIKFFDAGGGIGVTYDDEVTIKPYDYAQAILENLHGLDLTICCEPGRSMVANAGTLVSKVLYEKENMGKRFVIVDAAMNDFIRVSLYNMYHKVEVLSDNNEKSSCNVVGPVCESGDFFAKDRVLPLTQAGDILLVKDTGAYGATMSSNYNSRVKIAEIAVEDGKDRVIRSRESFNDLIKNEIEFL